MKRFRLIFPKYIHAVAYATAAIALSAIIFCVFKLFNAGDLAPYAPIADTASVLIALIIIGMVFYSLRFSGFTFKTDEFIFRLSIFSVNVPYEQLLLLRHDPKTNLLLLYYNLPDKKCQENIKYIIVNIRPSEIDSFVEAVRSRNRMVIYEIFDKNKEEKD